MTVIIPASWSEVIDKISILEIKVDRLTDPAKLANVRKELDLLLAIREKNFLNQGELDELARALKKSNETLWTVEDEIRVCEREKNFGSEFIKLARSVYANNDKRAALKRRINELLGSDLVEEKSYPAY